MNNANATQTTPTTVTVATSNPSAATSIEFWGMNGDAWDTTVLISLAVGVAAAAFVLIATGGATVVHKRETRAAEKALAAYKAEASGKVADAAKAASDAAGIAYGAGLKAGHAQTDVDAANLEIAKQKTATAQAQLETELIKQQVGWRELSQSQSEALSKSLSGAPMTVTVDWVDNPEVNALVEQVGNALLRGGVDAKRGSTSLAGDSSTGILISGPTADAARLAAALSAVGLPSTIHSGDTLTLKIGLKPRPAFAK